MFKKIALLVAAFGITLPLLLPAPGASALFEASKQEACKGAQIDDNATVNCADDTDASENTDKLLQTIVNLLTAIIGVIAVIMIIVNGLRLITSGGDSNSISSARNGVIYALVGLILVLMAQVIVRFVIARTSG